MIHGKWRHPASLRRAWQTAIWWTCKRLYTKEEPVCKSTRHGKGGRGTCRAHFQGVPRPYHVRRPALRVWGPVVNVTGPMSCLILSHIIVSFTGAHSQEVGFVHKRSLGLSTMSCNANFSWRSRCGAPGAVWTKKLSKLPRTPIEES